MTQVLALFSSALVLAGCNCGGANTNCRGAVGDAGIVARGVGEACTDGMACQSGLACQYLSGAGSKIASAECLAACSDAGSCAAGSACVELDGTPGSNCQPTCASSADCTGPFDRTCLGADGGAGPGVCVVRSCTRGVASCASGTTCVTSPFCCPPGAPCAAPPPGVCLR